jgi:DNA polymerase III subunit gamma/tau
MAYEVLARKWRPQVFQEVVGQEHIIQTLINAINTDRLAHAYLFSGARGVGKTSVARILAKALNCPDRIDGNPCNKCSSCIGITDGSSVDVQEIDGASNRGIDEIRELRENIRYMPSSGRYRVYIIDEVHMLTLQAFNALLKTLEEPPPHVKFVFATTEPHKVPITILSRCQRFDFKRLSVGMLIDQLTKITTEEGIEIKRSGLSIIAREADGSMRDAESLLDQVASYTGLKIEDKDINDILGIIDRDIIMETSQALIDGTSDKCLEIVEKIYNYGYDIKEFYRAIMDQYRNLIVCLVASKSDLLDMTDDSIHDLEIQAKKAGMEKLQQSLNILINREETLRFTSHTRLVLETIMVRICQLGDLLSFKEIMDKISDLEKRLSTAPVSYNGMLPGAVAEVQPAWDAKEEEEKDPEEEVDLSPEENWKKFMKFLTSKNAPMSKVLLEWKFKDFAGSSIELVRGESSFSSVYLDDEERMEKLTAYCREFFGRDVRIRIIGNGPVNKAEPPRTAAKDESRTRQYGDMPQPVQDVLKIFNGEIKGDAPSGKKERKSE